MDSREAGGGWARLAWGKVDVEAGAVWARLRQTGPGWRGDPAELVFSACDAGLGRLTHMVLCSVPAPCLNPYAAGGKVRPHHHPHLVPAHTPSPHSAKPPGRCWEVKP